MIFIKLSWIPYILIGLGLFCIGAFLFGEGEPAAVLLGLGLIAPAGIWLYFKHKKKSESDGVNPVPSPPKYTVLPPTPVQRNTVCPVCGYKNDGDMNFCIMDGTKLN